MSLKSDAVVAVERQAPPDRERPLYLPRLLEQIKDAVALRVDRQVSFPLYPVVEHAEVLVPVILNTVVHRVRDTPIYSSARR